MVEPNNEEVKKEAFVDSQDPAFLAVKGSFDNKEESKQYVKGLAQAISVVYFKHGNVKLRCIGAAALNNAVKAHIIARNEAAKKGINLVLDPEFATVSFQDGDRTAIVLNVINAVNFQYK